MKKLYRYNNTFYSDSITLDLETFEAISETPKGYWVNIDGGKNLF